MVIIRNIRRHWELYLLLLPSMVATIVFYYYPMVSGFYHSFTYWDIKRTLWIGLDNYERMFNSKVSLMAMNAAPQRMVMSRFRFRAAWLLSWAWWMLTAMV